MMWMHCVQMMRSPANRSKEKFQEVLAGGVMSRSKKQMGKCVWHIFVRSRYGGRQMTALTTESLCIILLHPVLRRRNSEGVAVYEWYGEDRSILTLESHLGRGWSRF